MMMGGLGWFPDTFPLLPFCTHHMGFLMDDVVGQFPFAPFICVQVQIST